MNRTSLALGALWLGVTGCTGASESVDGGASPIVDASSDLSTEPDAAGPMDLGPVLGDGGPGSDAAPADEGPCDSSFVDHCDEGALRRCEAGRIRRLHCTDENPHCFDTSDGSREPGCFAAPLDAACGEGVPACRRDGAQHLSLTCWTNPSGGPLMQSYARCPSTSRCEENAAGHGSCVPDGPTCSEAGVESCDGDVLVSCSSTMTESRLDCTLLGKVCRESLVDDDDALCITPGGAECDPLTHVGECLDATTARFCNAVGILRDVACEGGAVCCMPTPDHSEACCSPET